MKNLVLPLALLALTGLGCNSAGSAPAKQPTSDEMMAAMMRVGTPGAQHKALEPFVGTWDATVTSWMDPAKPPSVFKGRMVNAWILGGRYLEQKFEGEFMGQPFQGTGTWGFDVAAGKYFGTWIDSMSTGMMTSWGPVPKDGKTFTSQSEVTDPMTGKPSHGEEVVTLDSPTQHTMTMYEMRGDKKVKSMQIVYTRK